MPPPILFFLPVKPSPDPSENAFQLDLTQATLRISMRAGDQTVGITLEGGVLLPGRWGHVAFAIEATGIAKLIVDGAEVASGVFQGSYRKTSR